MKNKLSLLKTLSVILFSGFLITSCEKKEEITLQSSKWSLKDVYFTQTPPLNTHQTIDTISFSNNAIVFSFQDNNQLIITGSSNSFHFENFKEGIHHYEYIKSSNCETCFPAHNNLSIDKSINVEGNGAYSYQIFSSPQEKLKISGECVVDSANVNLAAGTYFIELHLLKVN